VERLRLGFRGVVFVALATFMTTGPFYRQVLDGRGAWIRQWRMYGGRASRLCQTRFERRPPERETWAPFRRRPFLEEHDLRGARKLQGEKAAEQAGRQLCRLHPPGTEVRYRQRCGHPRRGWEPWRVSDDLCEGTP